VINAGIYDTAAAKRLNGTMRPMERHALQARFESGSATSEASSAVHDAAIIEPDRRREPPHDASARPMTGCSESNSAALRRKEKFDCFVVELAAVLPKVRTDGSSAKICAS
jgi:hypothetical protein